jgi:hypothetical protein
VYRSSRDKRRFDGDCGQVASDHRIEPEVAASLDFVLSGRRGRQTGGVAAIPGG